jgi:hypothetical protein
MNQDQARLTFDGSGGVVVQTGETFARRYEFPSVAADYLLRWLQGGELTQDHNPALLNTPTPIVGLVAHVDRTEANLPELIRFLCRNGGIGAIRMAYRLGFRVAA